MDRIRGQHDNRREEPEGDGTAPREEKKLKKKINPRPENNEKRIENTKG